MYRSDQWTINDRQTSVSSCLLFSTHRPEEKTYDQHGPAEARKSNNNRGKSNRRGAQQRAQSEDRSVGQSDVVVGQQIGGEGVREGVGVQGGSVSSESVRRRRGAQQEARVHKS